MLFRVVRFVLFCVLHVAQFYELLFVCLRNFPGLDFDQRGQVNNKIEPVIGSTNSFLSYLLTNINIFKSP